jgi:hypothetical protein
MNETEIAVMSGLAKIREAGTRVVPVEVTKLEELYSENARLREALYRTLNYIENTESKLAIKLGCGDAARAALEMKP